MAVFLFDNSSFGNVFKYSKRNDGGDLVQVIMTGRGGRTKTKQGYVLTHNQEYLKNLPMFVSIENQLPIGC